MKRHTCIICKSKRYESFMTNVFANSWACAYPSFPAFYSCSSHSDIQKIIEINFLVASLTKLVFTSNYLTSGNVCSGVTK